MSIRTSTLLGTLTITAVAVTACGGDAGESDTSAAWREATSAEDGGGMDQLIEDAQAEGTFTAMGLYDDWANYGGLLEAFSEKYDIEIVNDTSTGSSQDLINAVVNRQGQADSLDYLDTGVSFAHDADEDGLLAEYAPATIDDIDEEFIGENGTWINHLGGTIAIGCDTSRIEECPTSFADLLDDAYRGQVAIPGDPTTGESGFMIVHAAALANGGSLDDIEPGIEFFSELDEIGNFIPVEAGAGTIETGETPIVLEWDYNLQPIAEDLAEDADIELEINTPSDGEVSSFYAASLNDDAPHPAVARLFFEFLFSDEGQNLLLEGAVSPVRLDAMIESGTVDQDALDELPNSDGITAPMPTLEQRQANQAVINEQWSGAIQ
ncbi:ABC transporter substrate-binding protein [Nesterenkonia xinjiangensis]|uniref:Putative spermidine/putrescine transport system substrate-binding protein n=1 Tax=Nesterenkonia xinjiangensis TaxID=225327 RepID=A0A7Z0GJJ7_9MICC|nr:ABC transporter substrate-binding protein [Nesterenkonia xinjiangensis]NYJ76928.1 putative spermidine/putrescine transport system substrate-binding protein [Nesterenkonia xinjiangensis]